MKIQNIRTIDFSKANKQIKDLQHKFLQSKMLRKNKENFNPNNIHQEAAARLFIDALQKPLLRNLRDLIRIQESVICERNMFEEICSVGVSENSDIGEGFKISFANLNIKQESIIDCQSIQPTNAPVVLFMVLQNIRKKKMIVSYQEIKFFVLQKNFTQVNYRLQYAKREYLRKIIVNKMKQEQLLVQVYLKYWSQQTQLLIFFSHFGSKINKIYTNKLSQYLASLKNGSSRKVGTLRLVNFMKKKIHGHVMLPLKRIHINLHLQNCLWKIFKGNVRYTFESLNSVKCKSPLIFEWLFKFQQSFLKQGIKSIHLHSLRQQRRYKSYEYGAQDLSKIINKINCKWAITKLQNRKKSKKSILAIKYMVMVLKKIQEKRLNWVLLRLNQ